MTIQGRDLNEIKAVVEIVDGNLVCRCTLIKFASRNVVKVDTAVTIDDMLEDFKSSGLKEVICTDISRDGMLQGPNTSLYTDLQTAWPGLSFTVSGGISSMADIEALSEAGLRKVITGKAVYEKRITLKDIEKWSLNA